MNKTWRIIIDGKGNGLENMAVDEALYDIYSQQRIPTLRLYGWDEPFVSLGYNQKVDQVLFSSDRLGFVRRITGGSAILHDQELTYSIICSQSDLGLSAKVKEAYQKLCSFLVEFYRNLGLKADFAKDISKEILGVYANSCFSNWQDFDILIANKKIGGNAQRRRKEIIFQHGSIPQVINFQLLKETIRSSSKASKKATCLNVLLSKNTEFEVLQSQLVKSFKDVFLVDAYQGHLSQPELARKDFLLANKYKDIAWNFKDEKAILV